ncbi:MAG: Leg1-related protein [Deltaproteobacteria bacterium]|nr:Leg1-related protein [Deltaproteobacteria bacterium]
MMKSGALMAALSLTACVEDYDGRDGEDVDKSAEITCDDEGIVAPSQSISCATDSLMEQYVYVKNDANETIRLKRFACTDPKLGSTAWLAIHDAPGDRFADSVLGAASLRSDTKLRDYVLNSDGEIYSRERDPIEGTKADWEDIGDLRRFPDPDSPGAATTKLPNQLALYVDLDGNTAMSVGFDGFGLFRNVPADPTTAPGGFEGNDIPTKTYSPALESTWTAVDWGNLASGNLWMKVQADAVPGHGSQIAHSTFTGSLGGTRYLIQGVWKDGNDNNPHTTDQGEAYFRFATSSDGLGAAKWGCNNLSAIATYWPDDAKNNTPSGTDNVVLSVTSAEADDLVEQVNAGNYDDRLWLLDTLMERYPSTLSGTSPWIGDLNVGIVEQTLWQRDTGRGEYRWWADINYTLTVWQAIALQRADDFPEFTHVDNRLTDFAISTTHGWPGTSPSHATIRAWLAYYDKLVEYETNPPQDHDDAGKTLQRLLWNAHVESIHQGLAVTANDESALPEYERKFAVGWGKTLVEYLAVANFPTADGPVSVLSERILPDRLVTALDFQMTPVVGADQLPLETRATLNFIDKLHETTEVFDSFLGNMTLLGLWTEVCETTTALGYDELGYEALSRLMEAYDGFATAREAIEDYAKCMFYQYLPLGPACG